MAASRILAINVPPAATGATRRVELRRFLRGTSPRIEPGDSAIFYDRDNTDLTFWGRGEVTEVRGVPAETSVVHHLQRPDELEAAALYDHFYAEVGVIEEFPEPRLLSDLSYSLKRVYRFDRPRVHFRGNYVYLSKVDATTIQENEVHWARTAFGILAGALDHAADRIAFVPSLLEAKTLSYREAALRLHDHIWSRYVAFANLVVETQALVLDDDEDNPIGSVVFVGADDTRPVRLSLLARDCEPVVAATKEPDPFLAMLEKKTSERLSQAFPVNLEDILRLLQVEK